MPFLAISFKRFCSHIRLQLAANFCFDAIFHGALHTGIGKNIFEKGGRVTFLIGSGAGQADEVECNFMHWVLLPKMKLWGTGAGTWCATPGLRHWLGTP